MSAVTDLGNRIKAIYDRVIAFVVILILLGSLVYLAVQVGTMRGKLRKFDDDIMRMKPAHPAAQVVDMAPYADAQAQLGRPFQMSVDTNRYLLVPEKRVWCQKCSRPTPYELPNCVFCAATNYFGEGPAAPSLDIDGDGMPTKWEVAHRLDPNDPADADEDADGDGFTNLQEFNAGTDPNDPDDHPVVLYQLRLVQIDKTPFKMVFVAKTRMPNGKFRFQVNYGGRSYFCKLNESVKGRSEMIRDPKTGKLVSHHTELFTVTDFREKTEQRMNESLGRMQEVDLSELDLKPAGATKPTTLVFRQTKLKYRAILELPIDNQREILEPGSIFKLRGETFQLLDMDPEQAEVVIMRLEDKAKFRVTRQGVTAL